MRLLRHRLLGLIALGGTLAACGGGEGAAAQKGPVPIRISYQPAFWALPWYLAQQKGWWAKVGLTPQMISFASGAPQVAAGGAGSWDVGAAGDIPATLGGAKYKLTTVAISDKEAAILAIMAGSASAAERYKATPALMRGKTIPVTMNSDGERAATACLEHLGVGAKGYTLQNLSPAEINAAMTSKRYDLAAVWAPNTYILESTIGAKVMCNGADTGLPITGHIFATPSYAKQHPEGVARLLAVYEHGVMWEKQHPQETLAALKEFDDSFGIKFPQQYLPDEVRDHVHLELSEELAVFKGSDGGNSEVDRWTNAVAEYMKSKGTISSVPDSRTYISGKYLELLDRTPNLKAFATEGKD